MGVVLLPLRLSLRNGQKHSRRATDMTTSREVRNCQRWYLATFSKSLFTSIVGFSNVLRSYHHHPRDINIRTFQTVRYPCFQEQPQTVSSYT
jgi:hypothetical protein